MAVIYSGVDCWIRRWSWGKLYIRMTRPMKGKYRADNLFWCEKRLLGKRKWSLGIINWILVVEIDPDWR